MDAAGLASLWWRVCNRVLAMTLASLRSNTIVDPFYPDADGKPMTESDPTRDGLVYAVEALKLYFQNRPEVYVSGNLFIYYEQGVRDAVVSPDVFVILGAGNQPRRSYKVWEEKGLTPDFVIEITSESTRYTDSIEKVARYAMLGVTEYFRYDPTGDYLAPVLQGLRLVEGQYQPIAPQESPGDHPFGTLREGLALPSDVLGLDLCIDAGELRFYDPKTGAKLLSYREAELGRRDAEAARQAAETARQAAEAARQAAEARSYRTAERLLATGMSLAEVAAMVELPIENLRERFEA